MSERPAKVARIRRPRRSSVRPSAPMLPQAVTDQHDQITARLFIIGRVPPANCRLDAEGLYEICSELLPNQPFCRFAGLNFVGEIHRKVRSKAPTTLE